MAAGSRVGGAVEAAAGLMSGGVAVAAGSRVGGAVEAAAGLMSGGVTVAAGSRVGGAVEAAAGLMSRLPTRLLTLPRSEAGDRVGDQPDC